MEKFVNDDGETCIRRSLDSITTKEMTPIETNRFYERFLVESINKNFPNYYKEERVEQQEIIKRISKIFFTKLHNNGFKERDLEVEKSRSS